MSYDLTTSVQNPEVARLQGTQPVSPVPVAQKPDQVQRNESAARGQELPPNQAEETEKPVNVEQVETAVSQISDFVQNFQRDLLFSIDKDSDRLVVKVVDSETQEVIRQIPSEETLRIARNLDSPDSLILRELA
jgi:flagellar protein FlaG